MEPALKCNSCSTLLAKTFDRTCPKCGWDNQVRVRKCLKCHAGMLSLQEVVGVRTIGGVLVFMGLVLWYFCGPLLAGAIAAGLGSLGALSTLVLMRYCCGGCGKGVDPQLLSTAEKQAAWVKRGIYLAAAGLLAAAAAVLASKALHP
ncbi:MAG TPA: hypothetical protein VE981_07825 [Planctomycetota bacterium]|nr:hypothetical protein [Planctomycetota bacterium]